MAWNKLKSMFVVSEEAQPLAQSNELDADQVLKDLEKYQLPVEEKAELAPNVPAASIGTEIDFQALYDQAGIPNTDEVEALERFMSGLDTSLPDAAKLAAAKAFLNAIGKAPADVITDAGRKIGVVRVVADTKRGETARAVAERQAQIAELEKQIQTERSIVASIQQELESVLTKCAVEESRLQGARMFFGHVGEVPTPQPPGTGLRPR